MKLSFAARRRSLTPLVCFGALMLIGFQAWGSSSRLLRLEDVLASVVTRHPTVLGSRADLQSAAGDLTAAEGGFDLNWRTRANRNEPGYYRNTRVDSLLEQPLSLLGAQVFAGWRLGVGNFAVYDGKQVTGSEGEYRFGMELPLLRNRSIDRRRTALRRAEIGREGADAQFRQTLLEVERLAVQRYWEWVAAGRRLGVQKRMLEIAEDRDRWLASRVAHGDLPEFERRDNQRSILQRKAALVVAERDLARQSFELSNYLFDEQGVSRIPKSEELPVSAPSPTAHHLDESAESWVARALKERPEVARLSASLGQAQAEVKLAENQRLPVLQLQMGYSRDLGQRASALSYGELETGVMLEIPIQNRVASGRATSAVASELKITRQMESTRARIEADVRDALAGWLAARERTKVARQEWELAVELEKGERARFEGGDSTILTVNLREQATADAALRMIDAEAELKRGEALLQISAGSSPAPDS